MAIHHFTPPIRGGERPHLPSSQIGPVTQAIRAMRTPSWHLHADDIGELRRRIADRIEADIALLDALASDSDLEDGADAEDNGDLEPSLGSPNNAAGQHGGGYVVSFYTVDPNTGQQAWGGGGVDDRECDAGDERGEENEYGGDIQDEPHDPPVDDIQKGEHRWDTAIAGMARAARRQAEALRYRLNRGGRA